MGPRGAGISRAMVLAEGRVLVCASRAASILPPLREGIRDRESRPFCSFSVSLGISGASATPSRSPDAVPDSLFLSPRSTVSTASSSPRCCAAAWRTGVPPREGEWRDEDWPQAVSAVQAANPASNTRERIRTFIFISLQECDRCTVRNQRLFTLAPIPELLRLFPCRICQTKCGMPPQAPGCTRGNWRPGTPCPHAALSRRECASTAASWRR